MSCPNLGLSNLRFVRRAGARSNLATTRARKGRRHLDAAHGGSMSRQRGGVRWQSAYEQWEHARTRARPSLVQSLSSSKWLAWRRRWGLRRRSTLPAFLPPPGAESGTPRRYAACLTGLTEWGQPVAATARGALGNPLSVCDASRPRKSLPITSGNSTCLAGCEAQRDVHAKGPCRRIPQMGGRMPPASGDMHGRDREGPLAQVR